MKKRTESKREKTQAYILHIEGERKTDIADNILSKKCNRKKEARTV